MILGAQFEQVTGSTKINGLITGLVPVEWDEQEAFTKTAPQIQIPNAQGGYTVRYYLKDGWYMTGKQVWDEGEGAMVDEWAQKDGWCDEYLLLVDDEYTPGEAMWLKSVETKSDANVAGQVPTTSSDSIDCPANFALRANIYPMPITLNTDAMKETGIAAVEWDEQEAFVKTAPQIQIPNAQGGYTVRYYLKDGWYMTGKQVWDPGEGAMVDEWAQKDGWCDEYLLLVDDVIPAAQGFWTKGVGSEFTLTFKK